MDLDAATVLRRFCFVGSLESVYKYQKTLDVAKYWKLLSELCQKVDNTAISLILSDALVQQGKSLVRKDEALFLYGVYLICDVKPEWKNAIRKEFPLLIPSDGELFLFCHYVQAIQKLRNHKLLTRTLRKAIVSWYEERPASVIREMFLIHRGEHGFTHRTLIKLCHITDDMIGEVGAVTQYFKSCSELLQMANTPPLSNDNDAVQPVTSPPPASSPSTSTSSAAVATKNCSPKRTMQQNEVVHPKLILMSKLRTGNYDKEEALKIITKLKLNHKQVPGRLLRDSEIVEAILENIAHSSQILQFWRILRKNNHYGGSKVMRLWLKKIGNKTLQQKENIHPSVYLVLKNDMMSANSFKLPQEKTDYLENIYKESFGSNQATGLRMHITINLQTSYKKKYLPNQKKLTVLEATIALAFGYYKKEQRVDVHYWTEDPAGLEKLQWTAEMDINKVKTYCNTIEKNKSCQRLTTPIIKAMERGHIYDVFVAIVPKASRSNPKNSSTTLCEHLDKYRETLNPKAKFVIVDLLKFKESMKYSNTRNENILEICGFDKHTTNLINHFALNHFA